MAQSVEPQIADLAHGWLKQYGLKYYIEQDAPTESIKNALLEYESKQGGNGGNRPDCNLLLSDNRGVFWPILIEFKGYKDKLEKTDSENQISNRNVKGLPDYKTIKQYAVNGAVHYANALLHYTTYENIIAIGITGYLDPVTKDLQHKIGVYYVGKRNLGVGQKVGEFSDLSFLKSQHFDAFINQVQNICLTPEELDIIKKRRENEINASLVKLNNEIFKEEKGLSEENRIYLVAATIIATIGIPNKVAPLEKTDLTSSQEPGQRDGDKIIQKIKNFLADEDKKIPQDKQELIIAKLSGTITTRNINYAEKGESQLRRIFNKIYDDLGIYYKIGISTDFTGRLFNEMYRWLGYTQDKYNDVVLTPSYVATLLAKLSRVDRNSYVWDYATGSAGLLVAAMNEMLADAKENIHSPEELAIKEASIKANQLLGLEILENIYMLAIINMILMGDGRSNILHQDSLNGYDGNYLYSHPEKPFPATAFVLNPPYSAPGNGMCFVERALSKMSHGYAAIIIQNSAGSGSAKEYNQRILKHSALLASIKMPLDLFGKRSSVQAYIYVFRVGEAHRKDNRVKFIDFSNDGYKRGDRKKTNNPNVNLKDDGTAKYRYEELVNIVHCNGVPKLHYLPSKNYYEGNIDPENGADWNQTAPVDIFPTLDDFRHTVADYLEWRVSDLIKQQSEEENCLGKI